MSYLIGLGHGLDPEDCAPFLIDPRCPLGVQSAQRDFGLDLSIYDQGTFCVLEWPVIETVEDLQALNAQLGIDSQVRRAVTVYLPVGYSRAWAWYNAYANRPQTVNYQFWPNDMRVMLNGLESIG